MKVKKILFVVLVFVISFVSCQDKIGGDDVLVDVTLNNPEAIPHVVNKVAGTTSAEVDPETRLTVISGGTTNWNKNDEVIVIDMIGVKRPFTAVAGGSTANFTGKLLAGRGSQKYYAYYTAQNYPIDLDAYNRTITVTRERELEFHSNDVTNGITKGSYCSMVGLPLTFEAENPDDFKRFSFYHVNSLIEGRVEQEIGTYDLSDMVFNKVVFTVRAIDPLDSEAEPKPFNTKVSIDMKNITYDLVDGQYTNISIPFDVAVGNEKINMMTTTITYDDNTTFAERMTPETDYYDIPIYALPTKDKFDYVADIYFYNGEQIVCHMQYRGTQTANGLNSGALNPIPFSEPNFFSFDPII